MRDIKFPMDEAAVRSLKVGDDVRITGVIVTARDAAHLYMTEHDRDETPVADLLRDGCIYHCGPVVRRGEKGWEMVAFGPTTSAREEPYQAEVNAKFGVRAVIGKGGMGPQTRAACQRLGCVYLHAIGGLAAALAECVERIESVYMLEEFGLPEAFWVVRVRDFPAVVTIDAHGGSLHEAIKTKSAQALQELMGPSQTS